MLQTFKAVLQGTRLEWSDEVPKQVESEQPFDVHVTFLQKTDRPAAGQTEAKFNAWLISVEQPIAMLSSRWLGPTLFLALLVATKCAIVFSLWLLSQWHLQKAIPNASYADAFFVSLFITLTIPPLTRNFIQWAMYESKGSSKAYLHATKNVISLPDELKAIAAELKHDIDTAADRIANAPIYFTTAVAIPVVISYLFLDNEKLFKFISFILAAGGAMALIYARISYLKGIADLRVGLVLLEKLQTEAKKKAGTKPG